MNIIEQQKKEFDERFTPILEEGEKMLACTIDFHEAKSFLESSMKLAYEAGTAEDWDTIYAQGRASALKEVGKRIEGMKHKIYDNWATTNDTDDERYTKLSKKQLNFNSALSDIINKLTKI